MRFFLVLAMLLGSQVLAGETPTTTSAGVIVNAIVSASGADTTNSSTATPFFIPTGTKITIWCNAAAYVITDSRTAANATGNGMPVSALEKFPTSTGTLITSTTANASLGGAIVRIFGTAAVTCYVFTRRGTE